MKVKNVIGPLLRLLNKSGKLLVTHSVGGPLIQKILKLAFKDKEAFPNSAKNIIEYLKDNPIGENSIFSYANPKTYSFDFKKTPDQTVTELFGHDTEAKWSNILYVGQIPEKEIQNLEKNKNLYNRVLKKIGSEKYIQFKNEIFCVSKIR